MAEPASRSGGWAKSAGLMGRSADARRFAVVDADGKRLDSRHRPVKEAVMATTTHDVFDVVGCPECGGPYMSDDGPVDQTRVQTMEQDLAGLFRFTQAQLGARS